MIQNTPVTVAKSMFLSDNRLGVFTEPHGVWAQVEAIRVISVSLTSVENSVTHSSYSVRYFTSLLAVGP